MEGLAIFHTPSAISHQPLAITAASASEHASGRYRPPAQLHFADDVFLRHHAPVTAVGAVVAVIAHYEVVTLGNHLRAPVVVAAEFAGHVVVFERDVVHVDAAIDDPDRVALFGNHALDERLLGIE